MPRFMRALAIVIVLLVLTTGCVGPFAPKVTTLEFSPGEAPPDGRPIAAIDDDIYRDLPRKIRRAVDAALDGGTTTVEVTQAELEVANEWLDCHVNATMYRAGGYVTCRRV